jgi:hypothetical protein
MDTFIVRLWIAVVTVLGFLSPYRWVAKVFKTFASSYGFVDCWVLVHSVGAIACWLFIAPQSVALFQQVVIIYGCIRILELILYVVHVVLLTPRTALRGHRRSMILAIHNYAEVTFWFAAFYRLLAKEHFAGLSVLLSHRMGSLYFSLVTMATVGFGDITPKDRLSCFVVVVHIVISMLLILIVFARFVSLLPTPKSLDSDEQLPPVA